VTTAQKTIFSFVVVTVQAVATPGSGIAACEPTKPTPPDWQATTRRLKSKSAGLRNEINGLPEFQERTMGTAKVRRMQNAMVTKTVTVEKIKGRDFSSRPI
jgi:hypothetical protein